MAAPRIAFIGAGALGSVIGGLMSEGGHDVTLVDQWPEHVDNIQRDGLRLSGSIGEHRIPVKALHIHQLQSVDEPFDIVFVAVKSYDTDWAARLMKRYTHDDTRWLSIQNGINDDRVAAIAGRERTLGFVTTIAAGLYEPGHAMRTDDVEKMAYTIGELDGADTPRAREVIDIASSAGKTRFTDNLMGERWGKLASNCALNATAGITGYGTAEVLLNPVSRRIGMQCAAETIRVGRALGFDVGTVIGSDAQDIVDAVEGRRVEEVEGRLLDMAAKQGSAGRPSFGQDVLKGRRTEIDFLNGYVSEKGREAGVPTPFCDALVEIVHSQPVGRLKPDPSLLDPVAKLLD